MPSLSLLIKPVSGSCNMRCRYCFYSDEMKHRDISLKGYMSQKTARILIDKALDYADRECTFAFQGGEPTLAGLSFFRSFSDNVRRNPTSRKLCIHYALQTNGLLLNDEWVEWLSENNVLVGVSLDGPRDIHDRNRVDTAGKGTFQRVTAAVRLLEKHCVDYNILAVVNAANARRAQRLYHYFAENGYRFQQYIECMDPIGTERGKQVYSLTPGKYAAFLKQMFDVWYMDASTGRQVHNRYFENLIMLMTGQEAENCSMRGTCSKQWVIEADGDVYPCDFYALDEWRLGNINEDGFESMEVAREALGFIQQSGQVADDCKVCRWYVLCRGGCRRNREQADGSLGRNYFCTAYKDFFEYAYPRLRKLCMRAGV